MSVLPRILAGGLLAVSAILGFLAAAPAAHLLPCGERSDLIDRLATEYGEKRTVFGLTARGRLIEVFVGPSGSWTILTSDPNGTSCVLDSGEAWRPVPDSRRDPVA